MASLAVRSGAEPVPAIDVTESNSILTVAVPAGAMSGNVVVFTNGGTSDALQADLEPPSVSLTSPEAGAQLTEGATVTFSAVATDDFAVAQVEFRVDGVSVGIVSQVPYVLEAPLPGGEAGDVTVEAIATDTAGLFATDARTIVRQDDTEPPEVALIAPAGGETVDLGEIDLAFLIDSSAGAGASGGVDLDGDGTDDSILAAARTGDRKLGQHRAAARRRQCDLPPGHPAGLRGPGR